MWETWGMNVPQALQPRKEGSLPVIALGLILLVLGFVLAIPILWTLGIVLLVVGVILLLLGGFGRPVMGRRHFF